MGDGSCPISLTSSYTVQSMKMQNSIIFMLGEWGSRRVELDPLFPLECPYSLALGQLTFPVRFALLC